MTSAKAQAKVNLFFELEKMGAENLSVVELEIAIRLFRDVEVKKHFADMGVNLLPQWEGKQKGVL